MNPPTAECVLDSKNLILKITEKAVIMGSSDFRRGAVPGPQCRRVAETMGAARQRVCFRSAQRGKSDKGEKVETGDDFN